MLADLVQVDLIGCRGALSLPIYGASGPSSLKMRKDDILIFIALIAEEIHVNIIFVLLSTTRVEELTEQGAQHWDLPPYSPSKH